MSKFAVFGNPIAQSKSPIIHQLFAEQCGVTLSYEKILGTEDGFESELDSFFTDEHAKGANITMPFKNRAAKWADEVSLDVEVSGAANTLVRQSDGSFIAHNTDGVGLVNDLKRLSGELSGKRVLIIGAGGAAQGVVRPILQENPEQVLIVNRTVSKASSIVDRVNDKRISASGLDDIQFEADVIVNSTSTSLSGELPAVSDEILASTQVAYDMVYGDKPTTFMQHCASLGVTQTYDGLGMLVGQAAQSFYLWHNVYPDVVPVISELRG